MGKRYNRDDWDRDQAGRCVRYTACVHNGFRGKVTVECATLSEAEDAARGLTAEVALHGRRAMVYGVTPEGWSIFLKSV